eukprot:TRINITY_DN466_c0_g4_i1.p1 TRINITY_DN466_c0_g4~~TRINITY_DN466_c0_g4_i1.p1  ORF type:complete len:327 (+),score=56.40 TRINITY_DN466_c0_g4_i1:66-1046(+)
MAEVQKLEVMAPSNPSLPPNTMHKNRLQEYAQRSAIALPVYQTINEGSQHAPKFRSTVKIDGASYRSSQTFLHRKEAEQDVAKHALECISRRIKDEGCPLIREDTIFCKSILNEFAVKKNLEKPTYTTSQSEGGLLPVFVSSLVFDGVTYTGGAGRNKKEAEQMAARAVLVSILGNSNSGTFLSQIIKSKSKLYAALHRINDSGGYSGRNLTLGGTQGRSSGNGRNKRKQVEGNSELALTCPHHPEFKKPKEEELVFEVGSGSTGIETSTSSQPLVCGGPVQSATGGVCEICDETNHVHHDQVEIDSQNSPLIFNDSRKCLPVNSD